MPDAIEGADSTPESAHRVRVDNGKLAKNRREKLKSQALSPYISP
ncbi:hypothetical protein [Ensifer sp. MJa1]